jgi:hypothetical protein
MSATKNPQITAQSRHQRTQYDRATLWRFHNSLYLGCVIGILTGVGFGQAALSWPKRAWQRASPRKEVGGERELNGASSLMSRVGA